MLRIAIAQTPGVRLDQWPETHALLDDLIQQAIEKKADLVLLPECAWPAYWLGSKEAYFAARAAGMPGPAEFLEQLAKWTPQIAICAGYVAENDGQLWNAACFLDRRQRRIVGTYHKCFLWDFDRKWFTAGRSIEPFDTEFGRIGVMICADNRLPEIPATLAARGARLILQPTAWVNAGDATVPWSPQADFLVSARAREFGTPIASASKWGVEGDTLFVGSSMVCDAEGRILVQAGQRETVVRTAEVQLGTPKPLQLTGPQKIALRGEPPAVSATTNAAALQVEVSLSPASSDLLPTLRLQPLDSGGDPESRPNESRPILLNGPTTGLERSGSLRFAAVSIEAARRFVPIRILALQGAHLIVVFGDTDHPQTLQARAMENRIFVLWIATAGLTVFDPRGRPKRIENSSAPLTTVPGVPPRFVLNLSAAIVKEVAWQTNIFTDRHPRQYAWETSESPSESQNQGRREN